jgi:hypothetical protein
MPMKRYLFLPFDFLKFWFYEAPREIIGFFASLNKSFFELFALPLFIKTYFKPLKNEYRQGLVGFSRAMGIFIKTILIIVDLIILIPLLIFEVLTLLLFVTFPVLTIWILFL